jgi:osmoprotectant transport system ATP-binding protein
VPYPLVVDDEGRPVAWLDEDDLRATGTDGEAVGRIEPGTGSPVQTVDRDDVLRDALSDLLQSRVQYGAVIDARGHVDGVLSIELIHNVLVPEGEGEAEGEAEVEPV